MAFSAKRAKAVAQGKVKYCILDGDTVIFSHKSFIVAVQMADQLQKTNPDNHYTMKLMEVDDNG